MRHFGLIGYPLGHSFSKTYFTNKFRNENIEDADYENYPIKDVTHLERLVKENPDLLGLNVTIPYKETVIPFIDELDETASAIGAVNTIKILRDSNNYKLLGFNTDAYGFERSLNDLIGPQVPKALILGTGGASKAVKYSLSKMKIDYFLVSRHPEKGDITYKDLDEDLILSVGLLINTTPLGTYPKIDTSPDIPYKFLNKQHILFDLVYNPSLTEFLKEGKKRNASVKNGYDMLVYQAEESWQIWNI